MPLLSGEIKLNPDLKIGSYSQVLENLDMNANILEELTKNCNQSETKVRNIL
jgi:ATPase subunit of ABC transporter with duplicated ATPase domains